MDVSVKGGHGVSVYLSFFQTWYQSHAHCFTFILLHKMFQKIYGKIRREGKCYPSYVNCSAFGPFANNCGWRQCIW